MSELFLGTIAYADARYWTVSRQRFTRRRVSAQRAWPCQFALIGRSFLGLANYASPPARVPTKRSTLMDSSSWLWIALFGFIVLCCIPMLFMGKHRSNSHSDSAHGADKKKSE